LKWHVELVPTEKTFLNAYISIEDNILVLRSPFNTHFIQDFRKLHDNVFVWDKNSRTYRSEYSTHALKLLLGAVNRHFKDVAFCPVVSSLLEDIQGHDNCVWEPTLKKINDQYIIVAINKQLHEVIKDIELNNDPLTLQKLSTYGIKIDTSVTNNDRFLEFAGSFDNLIDIDDLDAVIDWITALGSNIIFARRNQILYNRQVNDEIRKKLKERNITIYNLEDTEQPGIVFKGLHTAHYPYSSDYKKVAKIVSLVNSRPIQVK